MSIIRSVSGLRFTLDELSPQLIDDYAHAFSKFLTADNTTVTTNTTPNITIVIGRDGRESGEWIADTLANELTLLGHNVVMLGVVPTPTVQCAIYDNNAIGGIVVTASHNPSDWNGLKFLNDNGVFLDDAENKAMWGYLSQKSHHHANCGQMQKDTDAISKHINSILAIPYIKSELPNIVKYCAKNNIKLVIDAVNASGSVAVPELLDRLGCLHIDLFCDSSGGFPHTPEPIKDNLQTLSSYIKEHSGDNCHYIGIAVDPDADRLVLVNELGEFIGEEQTVCIAIDAYFTLNNTQTPVVVNQSTTMLADDIAERHNTTIYRSAVGEINVVKKMQEVNAHVGGEGSGGVILADCHFGRDSLVGITLLLALLAKRDTSLQELTYNYPQYNMVKTKMPFNGDLQQAFNKLAEHYNTANISYIDGIKITTTEPNAWLHIRSSNTEPIIRIMAEAPTTEIANSFINEAKGIII